MALHYFDNLREKSRKIDEGIDQLTEIWKVPHLLVGGYGDYNEEAKGYVEDLKNSLNNTEMGLKSIINDGYKAESDTDTLEQFLQESELIYQHLKEQCDDLENVFSEYGYKYTCDSNVEGETHQKNSEISEETKESDSGSPYCTDNLGVEFTPDLSWKCKTKPNRSLWSLHTPSHNGPTTSQTGIPTPVIKSIASLKVTATPTSRKYGMYTPT